MVQLKSFFQNFPVELTPLASFWEIPAQLNQMLEQLYLQPPEGYVCQNKVIAHPTAVIESGVVLKDYVFVGEHCFIGAHAYLRGGVWLSKGVTVGPGCEVKSSVIGDSSSLAHFNFVGDSLVGSRVNMEAGSIVCNHYNERPDHLREIIFHWEGELLHTGMKKFGALIGDDCRIGANAVLEPGVILAPQRVVGRLERVPAG